jgi:hypothetical protein
MFSYSLSYNLTRKLPGVSLEVLIIFCESVDFSSEFMCCKWDPLFLRFKASAVTLSGSQAGNVLPLPRSKGGAFPFLLTSMGAPLLPANLRSEIAGPTLYSGNSAKLQLDAGRSLC